MQLTEQNDDWTELSGGKGERVARGKGRGRTEMQKAIDVNPAQLFILD